MVSVNNAADAGSGVVYVQLYARISTGAWALVSQISTPGPYDWNYTPGANGTYYFQSRACDTAGTCEATPTGSTGLGDSTTIYDNVAPTSAATPPTGPINVGSIAVPWTASDATSGIAANGVTLYYNYNGGAYSAAGTASGTSGTFTFAPPDGDGTYCSYTRATDNTAVFSSVEPLNNGRVQIDLPLNTTFVGASVCSFPVGDAVFWFLTPQPTNFYGQRYLVVQALPAMDKAAAPVATSRSSLRRTWLLRPRPPTTTASNRPPGLCTRSAWSTRAT